MAAPEFAFEHYTQRQQIVEAAAQVAAEQWQQVDTARIADSWATQVPRLVVVVAGSQQAAAAMAEPYVAEAAQFAGVASAPVGTVNPSTFARTASDGRQLAGLLYQPAISSLLAIRSGASVRSALASGFATLDMIIRTQVADAGRVADQVALAARPALGYVRVVVGKTCSRCIVLAGRWYQYNAGFDRHP